MKTIRIDLPDPIVNFIHSLSKQEEEFAREAINEKVAREKDNHTALLIEGYKATAQEDLNLSRDFEHADLENL